MSTPRRRTIAIVSALACLGAATLGACGGSAPAPSLCSSANEYLWYGHDLAGGMSGIPPTGDRLRRDLEAMIEALDDMTRTVPTHLRGEVSYTHRYWSGFDKVLDRYDYLAGAQDMPEEEYERQMRKYTPSPIALRLTRYLERTCEKTSTPFPSDPTGKPG